MQKETLTLPKTHHQPLIKLPNGSKMQHTQPVHQDQTECSSSNFGCTTSGSSNTKRPSSKYGPHLRISTSTSSTRTTTSSPCAASASVQLQHVVHPDQEAACLEALRMAKQNKSTLLRVTRISRSSRVSSHLQRSIGHSHSMNSFGPTFQAVQPVASRNLSSACCAEKTPALTEQLFSLPQLTMMRQPSKLSIQQQMLDIMLNSKRWKHGFYLESILQHARTADDDCNMGKRLARFFQVPVL